MYNTKNSFEEIPAPPPPPDPGLGMPWPGNSNMIQPMMAHMMQPMMPGMMAGYNFMSPNEQNHNFNQNMMANAPPLLPPLIPGLAPETDIPSNKGHNMLHKQHTKTPPQIVVEEEKDEMVADGGQSGVNPTGSTPVVDGQKRARSRSPNRIRDNDRNRKRESDRGGDQGRRESGNSQNRRAGDRRRSRSRDRFRRDRGERRSKWESAEKDNNRSRGLVPVGEGMMTMTPTGGMISGQMFPGPMMPGNMEMMGQAQLEMMKGQQMGGMNPAMTSCMNANIIGGGMMMDPSVMGMQNQMFPPMYNQPVMLSVGMLEPPYPGMPQSQHRERPPGCRTIFVGGLSDHIRAETINEIFMRFGKITTMRLKKGFCHVRFELEESVEASFCLNGYRLMLKDAPSEANITSGLLIDYALNREDQQEHERQRHQERGHTPPRIEHISLISAVLEKIKNEEKFAESVPTLIAWLENGECSKKNANTFYSMIQATNNHTRRLMNDKMLFDEEVQEMKDKLKEKGLKLVTQLEQVVKVLNAANHKRVWDHFNKLQRKNVETWHKMSEELMTVTEEFNQFFNEDETDFNQKKAKLEEMYNEIKSENENLVFELEACKNEVHLAKSEAAREFEKFKAHFIAEQALLNARSGNKMPVRIAPMRPPPPPPELPPPPPPEPELDISKQHKAGPVVKPGEARLITVVAMFLLVHPIGASLDYILSYVRTLYPNTTQDALQNALMKHAEIFNRRTTGVGAQMEHKWSYVPIQLPTVASNR